MSDPWFNLLLSDATTPGVVPVLIGPLQVLLTVLPALLIALAGAIIGLLKPKALKNTLKLLWRQKLPVVIVVAGVAGAIWGGRALWLRWRPPVRQAEAASTDWPLARGTVDRCGAVPGAQGPTRGGLNWVYKQGNEGFFSSPAVVGNRVYVASATLGALSDSGSLYCFDADTGEVVWQAAPPGYRPTFSSPVVSGNYLVCGEGLHKTRDARVVCVDLRPGFEGNVLWTQRTHSHVECTPVVSDGRVYVGSGDDGYYCLELEPGLDGKAQVVWHVPTEKYPDAETGLAVFDGKVYAGLGNEGQALCVLDAKTGEELKRRAMPYPVFSPPSISDGRIYVGMGTGDYVHTAEEVRDETLKKMREAGKSAAEIAKAREALGPIGELWCLDLATLDTQWVFKTGQTILGAAAVSGDQIWFGSGDGFVYCLGRDGSLQGKWNAHVPIPTSPAVTARHVYVVTSAGLLYALDRRTCEPVWEFMLGTTPLFISSPAVARGRVYVGTQNDGFLCVGEPGEEKVTPLWPGHLGGPGRAGSVDDSPLPELGAFQWQFPADQTGQTQEACVKAPVAALGNHIYVPLAAGPKLGLAALPANAGGQQTPQPAWTYATRNPVVLSPAAVGDNVLLVDGKPGDAERHLHCLNAATGERRWQVRVADGASGVFSVAEGVVLIQDRPDALSALDARGQVLWSQRVGTLKDPAALGEALIVAAAQQPAALVALDRPTGRELWRTPLEAAPVSSPALAKSTIFIATGAGLEARSLVNGQRLPEWKLEGGAASGDFALTTAAIYYVNQQGELVSVDRASGAVLSRTPGASPGFAPLVSRKMVLFVAKNGLMRMEIGAPGRKPILWIEASPEFLQDAATSLVLKDSNVYLGRTGWGLVRLGKSQ